MAEITCDVQGVEEFQSAMQSFDAAMQREVYRYLHNWASDVKALAMQLVPVRTGHLQHTCINRL